MANTKLDRIERDIEKTRAKILEQQKKLKDLEAQKVEEENAQIVQMVKAVHLDGTQLAANFKVSHGDFDSGSEICKLTDRREPLLCHFF